MEPVVASAARRLTDLPDELLIHIAEYALTYEHGLTYRRSDYPGPPSGPKTVYRVHLQVRSTPPSPAMVSDPSRPFNALGLVCRRLWGITREMPYTLNTINVEYPLEILHSMLRFAPSHITGSLRAVALVVPIHQPHYLEEILGLTVNLPCAHFLVKLCIWESYIIYPGSDGPTIYLQTGDEIERQARRICTIRARNWTIEDHYVSCKLLCTMREFSSPPEWRRIIGWLKYGMALKHRVEQAQGAA